MVRTISWAPGDFTRRCEYSNSWRISSVVQASKDSLEDSPSSFALIAAVIHADLELSKDKWLLSLVCIDVGIEKVKGRDGSLDRCLLIGHNSYTMFA